jgi:predicted RNase H-like nuclease (RuvC/YqgF family)
MNKAKKGILRKFRKRNLAKSDKFRTFADEEPTAFAFTDFSKPSPILRGKDAERFVRIMEENNRKAAEKAKLPPTREELEMQLSYSKMMLNFQEHEVEQLKNKISQLEEKIKDLANGKTEEE